MSIEIGSKWVKDGEVVEVHNIVETVGRDEVIYYKCKQGKEHISYDYDSLEQYKPYEVVYEYLYALDYEYLGVSEKYYKDDEEFQTKNKLCKSFQRLDFTKRERK